MKTWIVTPVFCFSFLIPMLSEASETAGMKVGVFPQEVAQNFSTLEGLPADEVFSIAIAPDGVIYAGTAKGLAKFQNEKWSTVPEIPDHPIRVIESDGDRLLLLMDQCLYEIRTGILKKLVELPVETFLDIAVGAQRIYLTGERGLYRFTQDRLEKVEELNALLGTNKTVYGVAYKETETTVAAESGLFQASKNGRWNPIYPQDAKGRSWALKHVAGVTYDSQGRLWFACPQGVGCFDSAWQLYTGSDGLPYNDFTCIQSGENGTVWLGTAIGAIRFDGTNWAYREGCRWLPDDRVNDIAVTADGQAWLATAKGVGVISRRPMTLAQKAEFYETEIEKYIKRTEFGYLSEVSLRRPGDKSEIIYHESDNDGLWTSMYGAGECFAYAATYNPQAKIRARQAFAALRFLSTAPVGGEVSQQPGFVARTVVPTTEPDPNQRANYTLEGMKQFQQQRDRLWKVYYPRWPRTQDGKYWYKTDTSSDELDGHYFFYGLYFDLVAETPEEKEQVREVVRNITDHLIRNDFCLVDHDGKPTRWAVYRPKELNGNIQWYAERGLNSLSMLSYLAVAEHVTGDARYREATQTLLHQYHYGINAMIPKLQYGVGSGNQSDDEMAFMSFYNLIRFTQDEKLRQEMTYAFYNYWALEFPEMNPFFNFAYAASSRGTIFKNTWGDFDLSPWEGWLTDAVETLQGFPLDRCNWGHRNSHRLDIVRLPRQAASEPIEPPREDRGYRVNGKVLPVPERHFNHWNTDPWELDYPGDGQVLASGTVFLLPYYMGLYHGFILEYVYKMKK